MILWRITFQTPLTQVHHSLLIKSLRFWKIGSLNFGAEQYGQVFAILILKVVVINADYIGISKIVKFEGYLTNIKNHLPANAFCQFRISAHSLMCEVGRYCNIPYEQRLCPLFEMNKVESEHHFIFECSHYSDLRNQLPNQLTKDLDRHPIRHMYSLQSSSDPAVQTQFATFLLKALEKPKQSKVYTSLN